MDDAFLQRRLILLAPLLSAFVAPSAEATPINPRETFVLPADRIQFQP